MTEKLDKYDRILVCGARDWRGYETIKRKILKYSHENTIIVHGNASGADKLAQWVCNCEQLDYMGFPARWKKEGKAAGPIRNRRMLNIGLGVSSPPTSSFGYGEFGTVLVLAFHENIEASKGTRNMVLQAKKHQIRTIIVSKSDLTDEIINERTKKK